MNHANTLTRMFEAAGVERTGEDAVYFVAEDATNVHCFTEGMLDTWWANLSPERKAEIYERDLDGDPRDLRLHETLGRFSLSEVVSRIQRLSDGLTEAIERPYVRPTTQVLGEVDERAEAAGTLRCNAELPTLRTLPGARPLRLDQPSVQRHAAAPANVAVAHVNEVVLPASRHPESLYPAPVDAVENRRA